MTLTDWNAASRSLTPWNGRAGDARLLDRTPPAALCLMLSGGAALLLTGPKLNSAFFWVLLLLAGIIALVRTFIRGAAKSFRRLPLEQATRELCAVFFYCGASWGSGAWLLMPAQPSPALAVFFALAPCLALALILKSDKGVLAFSMPVAVGVATAAIFGAWPLSLWVASAILAGCFAIILFLALQHGENPSPSRPALR